MTITLVGQETYAGQDADPVVAVPAGAQEGDLLLAFGINYGGTEGIKTTPSGWTRLWSGGGTLYNAGWCDYITLPASPPASYTWDSTPDNTLSCLIVVFLLRGAGGIEASSFVSNTYTAPSVLTGIPGCYLFRWGRSSINNRTHTFPAGTTELYDATYDWWAASVQHAVGSSTQDEAGLTGECVITPSGNHEEWDGAYGVATVAIQPTLTEPTPRQGLLIYWVDIEDANGIKQGDGPILTATSWNHVGLLDRAGTFSFTMAADDPRRDLLAVKRIARCWAYDNGLKHLGAGIINDINLRIDAEGLPMLTVSGDDLLHELTYRNVGDLALVDETWFHPSECWQMAITEDYRAEDKQHSASYMALDLMIDRQPGDTTTRAAGNSYARRVVIKSPVQFNAISVKLYSVAYTPADVEAYYWDIASNDGAGDYEPLTITSNTTVSGGLAWQQDGILEFTPPATWGIATGDVGYKICFVNQTYGIPTDGYDLSLRGARPTETVLGPILGYAPAGWSYDVANGYNEITGYQEYGPNLITNAGFETFAGTADDGTSDTFTDWTVEGTDADDKVEATATATEGSSAVKITTVGGTPRIQQAITVEADSVYLFECDARGDATKDGYYSFTNDGDPVYGGRILSYTWTDQTAAAYGAHSQLVYIPTGITTVYLELRGTSGAGVTYYDNLSLRQVIGGGDVQLTFANESVLEALIRVTETNGEHFILSPSGRQVLWLRNDVRSSGVRCVGNVDPQAVEDEADIALLVNVTESQSAYDLVSRVYPFGGGQGDERATLANSTRGVPDGYTLDKTNNCLIRDASETAYGRIDRRLDLPDIVALNQSPAQLEYASNMLFDRSLVYLRRHSATSTALTTGDVPRSYNLTLAKCDRVLLPGYTVRVEYETWYNQTRQLSINRDMWILSSTVRVDETGIHTVALQCSTTDTPPMTDAMLISEMLRKQRASFAHAPGG